jgi:hypothetical protein
MHGLGRFCSGASRYHNWGFRTVGTIELLLRNVLGGRFRERLPECSRT